MFGVGPVGPAMTPAAQWHSCPQGFLGGTSAEDTRPARENRILGGILGVAQSCDPPATATLNPSAACPCPAAHWAEPLTTSTHGQLIPQAPPIPTVVHQRVPESVHPDHLLLSDHGALLPWSSPSYSRTRPHFQPAAALLPTHVPPPVPGAHSRPLHFIPFSAFPPHPLSPVHPQHPCGPPLLLTPAIWLLLA